MSHFFLKPVSICPLCSCNHTSFSKFCRTPPEGQGKGCCKLGPFQSVAAPPPPLGVLGPAENFSVPSQTKLSSDWSKMVVFFLRVNRVFFGVVTSFFLKGVFGFGFVWQWCIFSWARNRYRQDPVRGGGGADSRPKILTQAQQPSVSLKRCMSRLLSFQTQKM